MNRFHLSFCLHFNIDQSTYIEHIKCGKQRLNCAYCLGRQFTRAWNRANITLHCPQFLCNSNSPLALKLYVFFIHTEIVGMSLFRCSSHCLSSECVWLLGLCKSDLSCIPTHIECEVWNQGPTLQKSFSINSHKKLKSYMLRWRPYWCKQAMSGVCELAALGLK